jgi:hypothetical protein
MEKKFEVRDLRHKEKFVVDDFYLNGYARICGVYATAVYLSLCRHADKEQKCWPSLNKLAEEHSMSKSQVRRAIKILIKYHIISVERVGKRLNNRYYLIDKSEWSGRTLTVSPQNTHLYPDRTLIKDSHIKDTHIRKESSFKKPYFWGKEMRQVKSSGKWFVLDGKEWLEFVGRPEEIEWR